MNWRADKQLLFTESCFQICYTASQHPFLDLFSDRHILLSFQTSRFHFSDFAAEYTGLWGHTNTCKTHSVYFCFRLNNKHTSLWSHPICFYWAMKSRYLFLHPIAGLYVFLTWCLQNHGRLVSLYDVKIRP